MRTECRRVGLGRRRVHAYVLHNLPTYRLQFLDRPVNITPVIPPGQGNQRVGTLVRPKLLRQRIPLVWVVRRHATTTVDDIQRFLSEGP
jgi:hypothetical protein